MREIKFRGKTAKDGEIITGFLVQHKPFLEVKTYIKPSDTGELHFVEVVPASVGQYTGIKDANGVEIFEGDIVEMSHWEPARWVVDYSNEIGGFYFRHKVEKPYDTCHPMRYLEKATVIGNIHESPELLDA